MVLNCSLDIIFSIFLFGVGKSILDTNINPKKRINSIKKTFTKNLPILVSLPELVFLLNCI